MRWFVIGGILAGGAVIAYMKSRDPQAVEQLSMQIDKTTAMAREAIEGLQQNQRLLLEEVRALFRIAMEEGREASARRMTDLEERFRELRQEPRGLSNMDSRA